MQEGCVPWPESAVRTYREEGYWTTEVLGAWPAARAPEARARAALVTRAGVLTHQEVDRAADRMAAGLLGAGLTPGDRVVVQLLDEAELVVLSLALFRTGILPVYALPAHRSAEIIHLVSTAGAAAYVCPERVLDCDFRLLAREVLDRTDSLRQVFVAGDPGPFTALSSVDADPADLAALPAPDPEDVALFLLSGGTSGPPKLIPRTHADYAYQLRETARLCGVGPDTVYLAALPVEHNFALGCPGVLGTLRAGGTAVIAPAPTADACFPLIERARVTITSLVPPLVPLWLDAAEWTDHDLSSLEVLQVGGARLDPDTARQVPKALGCTLQQVYGMAEGLLNFTRLDDPEDVIVHTQGRPLSPADEVRVIREDGAEAGPGEVGELFTRGPYTLRGYYRAGERNRTRFTEDGFYRTGDLVRRTEHGDFEVVGRINDVVNRGGEKVPTLEVEEHLLAAFPLLGAAVIALPDALMGERTCACVVPRDRANPPTLREVKAAFRGRGVAAYKVPDQLVVLERLPMTGVGKVDKRALLAQLET
ncbi:2,3-dihydroxybenzoate-AMP ligase [Streptomyces venezuelae]|uniref:(2,3-dihydroxybenzoyl)adenylate synthase n=1 Tax=Streptomyces venezuelae TaxID=54571 RepID=UPI00123C6D33|nr:AMP-binding protein [Streptomyces venezuelae]QES04568.1 2,3-dihydroxybenzoate-AMP ligase [Streptomyces venezuelae]